MDRQSIKIEKFPFICGCDIQNGWRKDVYNVRNNLWKCPHCLKEYEFIVPEGFELCMICLGRGWVLNTATRCFKCRETGLVSWVDKVLKPSYRKDILKI